MAKNSLRVKKIKEIYYGFLSERPKNFNTATDKTQHQIVYIVKLRFFMKEKLELILKEASEEINNSNNLTELEDVKVKYLSRKGELNSIKKNLKDLSDEEKRTIGSLANNISNQLNEMISAKNQELYRIELNKKLINEKIDITLPSDYRPQGKIHPLTQTINEIVEIFQGHGFSVMPSEYSPEVETEYINFDMLNFPPNHFLHKDRTKCYIKKSNIRCPNKTNVK